MATDSIGGSERSGRQTAKQTGEQIGNPLKNNDLESGKVHENNYCHFSAVRSSSAFTYAANFGLFAVLLPDDGAPSMERRHWGPINGGASSRGRSRFCMENRIGADARLAFNGGPDAA